MIDPPSLLLVARGTIGTAVKERARRPFWAWLRWPLGLWRKPLAVSNSGIIGADAVMPGASHGDVYLPEFDREIGISGTGDVSATWSETGAVVGEDCDDCFAIYGDDDSRTGDGGERGCNEVPIGFRIAQCVIVITVSATWPLCFAVAEKKVDILAFSAPPVDGTAFVGTLIAQSAGRERNSESLRLTAELIDSFRTLRDVWGLEILSSLLLDDCGDTEAGEILRRLIKDRLSSCNYDKNTQDSLLSEMSSTKDQFDHIRTKKHQSGDFTPVLSGVSCPSAIQNEQVVLLRQKLAAWSQGQIPAVSVITEPCN